MVENSKGATKEKREVQQERLLRAACELVAEKGIAPLRTRDIASKAGVSVGTLHYCFATKKMLIKDLYVFIIAEFRRLTEHMDDDHDSLRGTLAGQARLRLFLLRSEDVVNLAWRAFTREAWTDPDVQEIVGNHYFDQRRRFEGILARARSDGELPPAPAIPDTITASMIVGLFEGLTVQWKLDNSAVDPDEYVAAAFRLLGLSSSTEQ